MRTAWYKDYVSLHKDKLYRVSGQLPKFIASTAVRALN